MQRRLPVLAAAIWVGAWLAISYGGLLDDALIYQRFAEASRDAGFPTYDGVTAGYGPTSLLFFALVTGATFISSSYLTTQIVSMVCYVACLAWIAFVAARHGSPIAKALGLVMLTPMAVRWLTNGMETSLATLLCLMAGWVAGSVDARRQPPVPFVVVLAAATLLVRPELGIVLVAVAVARALLEASRTKSAALVGAVAAGASIAAGIMLLVFHTIVPDAVAAKAGGGTSIARGIQALAETHASAGTFGMGLLLVYLASAAAGGWAVRVERRDAAALAVALMPLIIVFGIVLGRGHALDGFRYLVPFYAFSIAFVASWLPAPHVPSVPRALVYLAVASFMVGIVIESRIVIDVQRSAAGMLRQMASEELDRLSGETGVAFDVGFVGYFTRADVCDGAGLVGGAEHARKSMDARLQVCAARHPRFVFVTEDQKQTLVDYIDLGDWRTCSIYTRRNAFSSVTHSLLLAPELAGYRCTGE